MGVDTPGRAAFTLGVFGRHVRPLSVHRAERIALLFLSVSNCSIRCVKEAIRGCKCVFFCAWWRGEWWGRWRGRRGGGLGGSKAPDADPLKKNKGGRQQKNV